MSHYLDRILSDVSKDLEQRRQRRSIDWLIEGSQNHKPPIDPMPAFRSSALSVIAEVKRCSPSAHDLASIERPDELALSYVGGGAAAVSVLTERSHFKGSLDDLDLVRMRIDHPILRKDFIIDEYQIYENRYHRSDITLLILSCLDDRQLRRFHQLNTDLGMTTLAEVHDLDEAKRAVDAGIELIGINNRNLDDLSVDLSRCESIIDAIPSDHIVVAESGIVTIRDALRMAQAGVDAILVGSALVQETNPGAMIQAMIGISHGSMRKR